jgi:hypothetical protein
MDLHNFNKFRLSIYLLLISLSFTFATCNSKTVLLANFNNDNVGGPPGSTQPTGTVQVNPGSGSVTVVNAPNNTMPSNKWVQITHNGTNDPETTLTGTFSQFGGTGKYGLVAAMYIPRNAGVVTLQFEAFSGNGSFMHLDFMPEGDVRIDDSNTRFGHFPRDVSFVVNVALDITSSAATAEISLLGGEANGSINYNVQPIFVPVARQFGAVKFWIGFQHNATFFVDDILVTKKS